MPKTTKKQFKKFSLYLMVATPIILCGFLFYKNKLSNNDDTKLRCQSLTTKYVEEYKINIEWVLNLTHANDGTLAINGNMLNDDGLNLIASRTVEFYYKLQSDSSITFSDYDVIISNKDTMPNADFRKYFFNVANAQTHFSVRQIDNIYIFSNDHSPMFTCVEKQEINKQEIK